jgi:hypothetical protein
VVRTCVPEGGIVDPIFRAKNGAYPGVVTL